MKKIVIIGILLLNAAVCSAQTFKEWFDKGVKIGQSMETGDTRSEPAQIMFTAPKDSSSWLINVGATFRLHAGARLVSKLTTEYHRNTLIKDEQNNFSAGYAYTWTMFSVSKAKQVDFMSYGNFEYVYDRVEEDHSAAADILFSLYKDASKFNLNAYTINNRFGFFLSPNVGVQVQRILKAEADSLEGNIIRPLANVNMVFALLRDSSVPAKPLVTLSGTFIFRRDVYNSTDVSEDWTHLIKTSLDYFIINEPVKVSIGAAFSYGSDPLAGLADQQFWTLSLNLSK